MALAVLDQGGGVVEPHGAAQLLGLAAGEARRDHGDAQQLLLEERDAEGALEHRLEEGLTFWCVA